MSQSKLSETELDTFARHLWEHGDKRKLEAFRATFPNSKAGNESASVRASEIYEREIRKIHVRISKLQEAAEKEAKKLGMDIKEKMIFCRNLMARGSKAIRDEANGVEFAPGEVDRMARSGLGALQEINKLDGSYAPEKHVVKSHAPIEITRTVVYPKDRAEH